MNGPSPIVGDSGIHKRFLDSHVPFLQEFPEIQKLADKMWAVVLARYNEPPQREQKGRELEDHATLRLAQIIVFYLTRAVFDSFCDLFILAGNCRGFAAKMMLRVMYEHLVTASFIALKPEEAKPFDDYAFVEKWKIWTRTVTVVPGVKDMVPKQEIEKLEKRQKEVRIQLKSEVCKTCKQPVTQEAWTRATVETMAQHVDDATGTGLVKMYAPCYSVPTSLMHPTPTGLESRIEKTDQGMFYKELPEPEAHDALMRGHGLVLRLLKLMNSYFVLGFDVELRARWNEFPKIWDGALVDPPSVPEQETQ